MRSYYRILRVGDSPCASGSPYGATRAKTKGAPFFRDAPLAWTNFRVAKDLHSRLVDNVNRMRFGYQLARSEVRCFLAPALGCVTLSGGRVHLDPALKR